MWLRKDKAGAGGPVVWAEDGAIVEVDDDLAEALLAIPGGGFSEADPPKEPAKTQARKPATRKTPVAETGE